MVDKCEKLKQFFIPSKRDCVEIDPNQPSPECVLKPSKIESLLNEAGLNLNMYPQKFCDLVFAKEHLINVDSCKKIQNEIDLNAQNKNDLVDCYKFYAALMNKFNERDQKTKSWTLALGTDELLPSKQYSLPSNFEEYIARFPNRYIALDFFINELKYKGWNVSTNYSKFNEQIGGCIVLRLYIS